MRIILDLAAASLLLLGCMETHNPKWGTVIDKEHQASSTTVIAAGGVLFPVTTPERWVLEVRTNTKRPKIRFVSVPEGVYENTNKGDTWEFPAH
jgi:hypothetical protein